MGRALAGRAVWRRWRHGGGGGRWPTPRAGTGPLGSNCSSHSATAGWPRAAAATGDNADGATAGQPQPCTLSRGGDLLWACRWRFARAGSVEASVREPRQASRHPALAERITRRRGSPYEQRYQPGAATGLESPVRLSSRCGPGSIGGAAAAEGPRTSTWWASPRAAGRGARKHCRHCAQQHARGDRAAGTGVCRRGCARRRPHQTRPWAPCVGGRTVRHRPAFRTCPHRRVACAARRTPCRIVQVAVQSLHRCRAQPDHDAVARIDLHVAQPVGLQRRAPDQGRTGWRCIERCSSTDRQRWAAARGVALIGAARAAR